MFIVDAHQDIATNALTFGRDYTRNAWTTRRREVQSGLPLATLGLPDALLGRVAIVFATLFAAPANGWQSGGRETYSTPQEAYALAMRQMDYYERLHDEQDKVQLIRSVADLDTVLESWQDGTEMQDHIQGLVVLMEGADPVLEPKQLEEWLERGVRIVGPAWGQTRYSAGTGTPGTLSLLGYELLEIMSNYRVILDLSHMAERAFLEAVDSYDGALIASHSNPRKFCDSDRHLSDEMIARLIARDGVMGIVLYNRFLHKTWSPGDRKSTVPLSRVVDVIDYVCQIAGNAAHVGIGSNFDGGFGANSIPDELDTVSDLWLLKDALRERGYDEVDIAAVLGGNMLRQLRTGLPE